MADLQGLVTPNKGDLNWDVTMNKNIETIKEWSKGVNGNGNGGAQYCVCDTPVNVPAKIAPLSGFQLYPGAQILLKITHGDCCTKFTQTLNIENTGAFPFYSHSEPANLVYIVRIGGTYPLVFTGEAWEFMGNQETGCGF